MAFTQPTTSATRSTRSLIRRQTSSYITILDSSGNDTINYVGSRDAQIDLLAATLDYTPTGGGVVILRT